MFNKENLKYFVMPNEADNWVWRIEHGVGEWVKRKGHKSYWKLVFWVSERMSVLDMKLSEFPQLLIEECSGALDENETAARLGHNIEKFPYNRALNDFDRQPDSSYVRVLVSEVEALLMKQVDKPMATGPTLEQRIKEYAENAIVTGYDRVRVRPVYNGVGVSLSVERFVSQKFRDENRPSSIVLFECVEESVTESKVYELNGKFGLLPNKKLYIASTSYFSRQTQKAASTHSMGLIMVNLQYRVDESCFVLPRSSERKDYFYWRQMLSGERSMTLPLIACEPCAQSIEGLVLSFSMEDVLRRNKFTVQTRNEIKAPVMYFDDIENIALDCVKEQMEYCMSMLQRCGDYDRVPDCSIDPYRLAETMGLRIERGVTGEERAMIDIDRMTVTLNTQLRPEFHCARFAMAHEDGHYVLHYDVMSLAKRTRKTFSPVEKGWLEQQANHFASCLLMPAPIVRQLFNIYAKRHILGPVALPLPTYNCCFREHIIKSVANTMNVSVEAATIRLEKMGLIYKEQSIPLYLPAS